MSPSNQALKDTFLFDGHDLRANRLGQLSPRQQARLQASGASMRLALAIFVVVMLGSVGFVVANALGPEAAASLDDPAMRLPLAIMAVVVGGVIGFGVFSSQPYIAVTRSKQIKMAEGVMTPGRLRPEAAYFEIKIGTTRLRLLTEGQLSAFQEGTAYRLFYLAGPVPTILSGEVVGSEAEALEAEATTVEQDEVVQMQRRARPILLALAGLALGIPLMAWATANLASGLNLLVWAVMLAVGVGFVVWALRRLTSKN